MRNHLALIVAVLLCPVLSACGPAQQPVTAIMRRVVPSDIPRGATSPVTVEGEAMDLVAGVESLSLLGCRATVVGGAAGPPDHLDLVVQAPDAAASCDLHLAQPDVDQVLRAALRVR